MCMKGLAIKMGLLAVLSLFVINVSAQRTVRQQADSIVKYQMKSGGWPKNQDWLKGVDPKEAALWKTTGIGSTIDNGATVTEMEHLAAAVNLVDMMMTENAMWLDKDLLNDERKAYCKAFTRGLDFLLNMQYDSGGFPQFYPPKNTESYTSQITFNDQAMVSALKLLRDVANGSTRFNGLRVDKSVKKKCQTAFERGIQCILFCQIRVDETGKVIPFDTPGWRLGIPTVWCQQHDKDTFDPVKARAYELPSFSGHGETCAILELLMDLENPSAEVKMAVKAGVEWLKAHAMHDVALEHFTNEDGKPDVRLVKHEGAQLLWARLYDLEKAEPLFCDRDGIPRKHLEDVGYERRNGYQWVGNGPQRVIERYEKWSQR